MTYTAIRATIIDEVRQQLHAVADPELDEPITDLGFIESIGINANDRVRVVFGLPTYRCDANFTFMMAEDIGERIEELLVLRCFRTFRSWTGLTAARSPGWRGLAPFNCDSGTLRGKRKIPGDQ